MSTNNMKLITLSLMKLSENNKDPLVRTVFFCEQLAFEISRIILINLLLRLR